MKKNELHDTTPQKKQPVNILCQVSGFVVLKLTRLNKAEATERDWLVHQVITPLSSLIDELLVHQTGQKHTSGGTRGQTVTAGT